MAIIAYPPLPIKIDVNAGGVSEVLSRSGSGTADAALRVVESDDGPVSGYLYDIDLSLGSLVSREANAYRAPGVAGATDSLSIQGVAGMIAVKVDGSAVAQPVTDNSGSLTVDAPVGTPVFVRLSDGAAAIATLPVSLASVPSHAVTNAGTFAVQDSEKVADNGGFTDGTTKVLPVGYIFDETAGTALTENDVGAARMDSKRALVNVLEDGTTRGLRAGVVDETGASAVDALAIGGGTPHDSVDSGNPVKVGGVARTTFPAAVASGDRANNITDVWGRSMVTNVDFAQQVWKQVEATTAQTGTAIWTPAAGKKFVVTSLDITFGGTTAGVVTVWAGASGDTTFSQGTDQVFWRGEAAPSTTSRPSLALSWPFGRAAATADHILRYTTSANVTIYITVYGYETV